MGHGKAGGAAKAKAAAASSGAKDRKAEDASKEAFSGHDDLTPDQVLAVHRYQESSFDAINDFLRGKKSDLLSELKQDIKRLDKIVASTTINKDMNVYRGFTSFEGFHPKDLRVGDTFSDKGFTSTSVNRKISEGFVGSLGMGDNVGVLLSIKVAKGSKGLAVHKVATGSSFAGESEVLLPRGNTVKITKITKRKDGNYSVQARLQ